VGDLAKYPPINVHEIYPIVICGMNSDVEKLEIPTKSIPKNRINIKGFRIIQNGPTIVRRYLTKNKKKVVKTHRFVFFREENVSRKNKGDAFK